MHDAIFVLGGGVRDNFALPEWSLRRFDLALQLRDSEPFVSLSAGTAHRPILVDSLGLPMYESIAGAEYLRSRGVAERDIFTETASWDTIGNAYFARVLFADVFGWQRILVVTSEFHMPRSEAIFRWVFQMDRPGTELSFAAASDQGLDVEARSTHERQNLAKFEAGPRSRVASFGELHRWIYSEHDLYAAGGRHRTKPPDATVLSTY